MLRNHLIHNRNKVHLCPHERNVQNLCHVEGKVFGLFLFIQINNEF